MAISTPIALAERADGDLVSQARAGEGPAREELARRHRQVAYVFALQLLGNPDDALDVAQESMLRFFTNLERFDTGRPVRPWLLTIVRNLARDLWRRRKVRIADSLDAGGDLAIQIVDPVANPERDAQRAQIRRFVWRGLSALPPAKREILVLRDWHDLAYGEIAAVLKIPIGTVMSRLHSARKALREELVRAEGSPFAVEEGGHHD